jgi:hypothetical protein
MRVTRTAKTIPVNKKVVLRKPVKFMKVIATNEVFILFTCKLTRANIYIYLFPSQPTLIIIIIIIIS